MIVTIVFHWMLLFLVVRVVHCRVARTSCRVARCFGRWCVVSPAQGVLQPLVCTRNNWYNCATINRVSGLVIVPRWNMYFKNKWAFLVENIILSTNHGIFSEHNVESANVYLLYKNAWMIFVRYIALVTAGCMSWMCTQRKKEITKYKPKKRKKKNWENSSQANEIVSLGKRGRMLVLVLLWENNSHWRVRLWWFWCACVQWGYRRLSNIYIYIQHILGTRPMLQTTKAPDGIYDLFNCSFLYFDFNFTHSYTDTRCAPVLTSYTGRGPHN